MLELVQVSTTDGVRLDGALETPTLLDATSAAPAVADAWLLLHGTGSNFYSGALLANLAPRLAALGATVLRVNTRGHDQVSAAYTPRGHRWIGAAFERVADAPLDIAAWINLLVQLGHQRVGILGHSLGAVKAIYALANLEATNATSLRHVTALAAVSPPRLSHSHYAQSARAGDFLPVFDQAAALVGSGQGETLLQVNFPLRYIVSAAAYVDRYGPDEHYNILKLVVHLPCPTLVTYGSQELQSEVAFAGMPEAIQRVRRDNPSPGKAPLQVAIVAGADHLYTATHDALFASFERWLRKLPQSN